MWLKFAFEEGLKMYIRGRNIKFVSKSVMTY